MKRFYNKNLKNLARELRKNSTLGEIILWRDVLKARKMRGYQFNRQFPIKNYVVDFICRKLKLIIEVDGYSHNFKVDRDQKRDRDLNDMGYKVLHIREQDILKDINGVKRYIERYIEELERG